MNSQDILNPIYDESDLIEKISESINFFPHIRFKIKLTFRELYNQKIDPKLKDKFNLFYKLRNDIHHNGVDFYEKSEEIRNLIIKRLSYFRKSVLKLLFKIFNLNEFIDSENKVKFELSFFFARDIKKE
ncbi:MAG: hypothetical protein BAJALOKI2v1_100077 [Promethearchaeota archaeon]|nr:MAG: hypothetical protein BAJALOKI2v1_100077 [Candidatus Lokiarchaeota archaeon]